MISAKRTETENIERFNAYFLELSKNVSSKWLEKTWKSKQSLFQPQITH